MCVIKAFTSFCELSNENMRRSLASKFQGAFGRAGVLVPDWVADQIANPVAMRIPVFGCNACGRRYLINELAVTCEGWHQEQVNAEAAEQQGDTRTMMASHTEIDEYPEVKEEVRALTRKWGHGNWAMIEWAATTFKLSHTHHVSNYVKHRWIKENPNIKDEIKVGTIYSN